MDPFVSNLKRFIDEFGDDGQSEINAVCSKHQLTFAPQEATSFSYGGLEVKDGILRLVFQDNSLATNTSDVSQDFANALKDAPPAADPSALNIVARKSVRDKYEPGVEQVRSTIAELVNMPSLRLSPNFEENATALAKSEDKNPDWDQQIGQTTLDYFKALQYQLEREKFKDDDMLQEGFQEVVRKGEICFHIVNELDKGTYNECMLEDGILYLQVRCSFAGSSLPGYEEWFALTIGDADYTEVLVDQRGRRS